MLLLLGAGVAEQLVLLLSFCGRVRIPMLVSQEGYNARVVSTTGRAFVSR